MDEHIVVIGAWIKRARTATNCCHHTKRKVIAHACYMCAPYVTLEEVLSRLIVPGCCSYQNLHFFIVTYAIIM